MKIENHSITIIGSGPSGVATALKLDRLGIPCMLIDKATFPRDKICGDGISHRTVYILKQWIDPNIVERFASNQNIQLDSWGLRVEGTKNNRTDIGYLTDYNKQTDTPSGFVCKRWEFDNFLVQEVKKSPLITFHENIEIIDYQKNTEGWLIKSKNEQLVIQSQLLIVADGAQSRFARIYGGITLDPKHYMASVKAYYKGVAGFHKDNYLEFYFLKNFLPGYFWVFPLPNGEANVGIAMVSDEVSKRKLNLKKSLLEVIETTPKLKKRFENAELISDIQGFGLPLGSKKRQLSGDNYILVGDAASLIDPLTGEGIANALLSGVIAAEQAAQCLTQNDFSATILRGYDERIYRIYGQEFKTSYLLQRWFKNSLFFNIIFWLISKNTALARTFATVFNDTNFKMQLLKPKVWWKFLRNKNKL